MKGQYSLVREEALGVCFLWS